MLFSPIIIPYKKPFTFEYLQNASSTANVAGGYTFASQNLGAADPTREIFAVIIGEISAGLMINPIVTIGGVSATVTSDYQANTTLPTIFIAHANVPTGTTGDVVFSFGSGSPTYTWGICSLFRTTNRTTLDGGFYDHQEYNWATDGSRLTETHTVNVVQNGFVIGGCKCPVVGATSNGGVTERAIANIETDSYIVVGDQAASAGTDSVIFTFGGSAQDGASGLWSFER